MRDYRKHYVVHETLRERTDSVAGYLLFFPFVIIGAILLGPAIGIGAALHSHCSPSCSPASQSSSPSASRGGLPGLITHPGLVKHLVRRRHRQLLSFA